MEHWDQDDQLLPKTSSQNQMKNSRSRIIIYESTIDEVLKVWRLNSQSGTQEFLKIGQKCFRRKFKKHSRRNVRKWSIGIMMINYCLKKAQKIRWRISRSRIKSYEKYDSWSPKSLMIKQSKWDTRISENWTEVFSKKIRETFREEC